MKNQLKICIDSIMKNGKDKSLVITGWGLDEETKEIPRIRIDSAEQGTINVEYVYRGDVNGLYKLNGNQEAGFVVTVHLQGKIDTFDLTFYTNANEEIRGITANDNYPLVPGSEGEWKKKARVVRKGLGYLKRNGLRSTIQRIKLKGISEPSNENYLTWIKQNEQWDSEKIKAEISDFTYQPKISVLMPVYNVEQKWLEKCIQSVQAQFYDNWELCISDDASTDLNVKKVLDKFVKLDSRIKVVYRTENGHISKATNSALEIATGDFVALLDNDDELAPIAFYEVVKLLNKKPDLDLIYSDEDKIDMQGNRFEPAFKPDWSPDLLLGTNYISHLGVYRRSIVEEIGGFRAGLEGSQDFDLVLRFTEKTTAEKIAHIPEILYYWRVLPTSTAADQSTKGYAFEAGRKALEDALVRRGIKGTVTHAAGNGLFDVNYDLLSEDLVSIIIPTKNGYDDMRRCLKSIVDKTSYENYEIIVADNGSTDPKMDQLYKEFIDKLGNRIIIESIDIPFNYSRINNLAAKKASGKYLLFLNNDTEVITTDWLERMISSAQFDRIGCVGAKLYYPNHTIQHAGVILGLGGAAGHGHHTFPRGDFGYFGKLEINVNYLAVTAACLMVKKQDFDDVNGFDEELTVAFNDVDLCLKIHKLGRNNIWLHSVELFHYESQSRGHEDTPEKIQRFQKETALMESRWGSYVENDPYYNPNLTRIAGDFSVRVN
ncbi:glycosyltransferase family 2 protein [Enterococcus sp. 5H]|uniref:glycosyltransferase family 2 protein n=1 Tax=Enterococcus sp. 5H TaxID=1229490 RepID=UPI0023041F96|nr:glycosyltransferase family 2 protein [Enterococcus sp. 5H]